MNCTGIEFKELSEDILGKGACLRFQAKGISMQPAIKDGDILNVVPVDFTDITPGDVVLYKTSDSRVIAHRVIRIFSEIEKPMLIINADTSRDNGDKVSFDDLLGRVSSIERNGKRFILDHGIGGGLNKLYYKSLFLIKMYIRLGSRLLRCVYSFRVYRSMIKKVFKRQFIYCIKSLDGSGKNIVVKLNNEIIGRTFISYSSDSNDLYHGWWIFGMWVNWRYRCLGVGERLVKMSCDLAVQQGALEVKLLVFEGNKPAISLYQKAGFSQTFIPGIDEELNKEAERTGRRRIIMVRNFNAS